MKTYSKAEEAFALALKDGTDDMAGIAADVGYSDQSHMGRQVRAQTGFTPTELMRGLESDEAFWSYRLMGERY
ncbi:helix-turn-helix domain-containing protein [Planktotalea sp.]|uniref:helix-turn-helix domain-containing protein n=1 Tax=Planktotalea sp. TaxID=2029877 RepID=UPI0025EB6D0C|nr:helix-turn-helix domain-containing protein [Planktotalea sp.]